MLVLPSSETTGMGHLHALIRQLHLGHHTYRTSSSSYVTKRKNSDP